MIKKNQVNESYLCDYFIQALQREIKIQREISQLNFPFFVRLLDEFEEKGCVYLILELCHDNLENVTKEKKLSVDQVIEIVFQIGLGVKALHDRGITHRDLKLSNVLIQ